MKVGDLVKLKHRGNGHPSVGMIVSFIDGDNGNGGYEIMWDESSWNHGLWAARELEVIDERTL